MRDLVVSFCYENLDWLSKINNHRLFLYDKSGMDCVFTNCYHHIKLPNIGRESHTYAYHIATNYESLSEWTVFTQGWPFDHCYYFLNILAQPDYESIIRMIKEPRINNTEGFVGLSEYAMFDAHNAIWAWPEVLGYFFLFHEYCGWKYHPIKKYVYNRGALLMVHRDIIHLRKKSFYEGLVDLHQKHFFVKCLPWMLELTWKMIFSKPETLSL